MSTSPVLKNLGYDQSPNYLERSVLENSPSSKFRHVYRRAGRECGLDGVYVLDDKKGNVEIPIVFYCRANNEAEANDIHRRVWNQDIVPYILVETPEKVRLYCGFRFNRYAKDDRSRGILLPSVAFNEIAERLDAFHAHAIDSGRIWDVWGDEVTTRTRVDWALLDNLHGLELELRRRRMARDLTHALIGKFVYLRYLRDRDILSDRKLSKWGIDPDGVFSRNARLDVFEEANRRLNEWLNGAIFPLDCKDVDQESLRLVAGVFSGDSPQGQLHLDFQPYDFSFIPIETLSVIYEQFLHSPEKGKPSRGKQSGAYYTPIPLVNYMLNELERRRPLQEGMTVLDPSCGSGAFLVQCYRALIEKERGKDPLRPSELRSLLIRHIFGVDRDGDACQVAEMSLILTLLDYTTPPDLENSPRFKLPVLKNNNIFQADFFDPESQWNRNTYLRKFDWIIGNPPWKEYRSSDMKERWVGKWCFENAAECPVGGNQIAEAFIWRSMPFLKNNNAVVGMVLPAMTLFKKESATFRRRLFNTVKVWLVANFSNLAYVLFAKRSERPAMALFFSTKEADGQVLAENERILAFSPFILTQRANRSSRAGAKKETWNIVVNGSEIEEVRGSDASTGSMLPWKLAMWGSYRDGRLLRRIEKQFPEMVDFLENNGLTQPHQGFELRDPLKTKEQLDPLPKIAGEVTVDFSKLKHCGRIFTFPERAFSTIPDNLSFVRKGRGRLPEQVSRPPHLIVDASRRFAIYSDKFIAVPARKIGIAGPKNKSMLLKALSLYLSSDFVTYQQFFSTPEWGVSTSIATLEALKRLPVPLDSLSETEMREWAGLHDALVNEGAGGRKVSTVKIGELNGLVMNVLGLKPAEQLFLTDFLQWNMQLIHGKAPCIATEPPSDQAIRAYLDTLQAELDAFIGDDSDFCHALQVLHDQVSSMVAVFLTNAPSAIPKIVKADAKTSESLAKTREHLLRKQSQWLYFKRDLRVYANNCIYLFKPMERIQWTRRQALLDAGEVIAETLELQEG